MTARKKNILLILTDQHRFDMIGANGSKICQSPALDSFAQSGVNFQNAYSVCGLCTPARASIHTGLLPHHHGLTRNDEQAGQWLQISESIPTLGERLSDAGYDCHFVGKWHAGRRLPRDIGFTGMSLMGYGTPQDSEDYEEYLSTLGLEKPVVKTVGTGWAHNLTLCGTMSGPVEASIPGYLAHRTLEYIDGAENSDKPFFLALNFWGPHAPYLPCEPYASMYKPEDIPPWGNFEDDFTGKPGIYKRYRDAFIGEGNEPRSWDECAKWLAHYFGFASQIDDQIARVFTRLEELGLSENTAVIFSSDHGDLCGAHGGMHDKGGMMVQEVYHIPLMARFPGGVSEQTCAYPMSNLDIPATILDIAGCLKSKELDGKSFLPVLQGKSMPEDTPDFVVSEFFGHHYSYETRMLIYDKYKYVFHPSSCDELYNLEEDPWELNNLIDSQEYSGQLNACRRRLLDWAKSTGDELCVLCGLFHERLAEETDYNYQKGTFQGLRESKTSLIKDAIS